MQRINQTAILPLLISRQLCETCSQSATAFAHYRLAETGNDTVYCSDSHQYLKALSGADVRVNTLMALCVRPEPLSFFFVRFLEKRRARRPTATEVAFLFRSLLFMEGCSRSFSLALPV